MRVVNKIAILYESFWFIAYSNKIIRNIQDDTPQPCNTFIYRLEMVKLYAFRK